MIDNLDGFIMESVITTCIIMQFTVLIYAMDSAIGGVGYHRLAAVKWTVA
jgi:hypothetical protein